MKTTNARDEKEAIARNHFDSNLVFQEHVARYEFAKAYVKGKSILDLACGMGHGTQMLSTDAKTVVGLELDSKKLRTANRYFRNNNTAYLIADARFLPFKNNRFDVIVSLEVIEHLIDQDRYLSGIVAALRPNGIAIISTPNKDIIRLEGTVSSPLHVKELTYQEFDNTLSVFFTKHEIFGQTRRRGVKGASGIIYHIVRKVDILKLRQVFSRHFKDIILTKLSRATGAKDRAEISSEDVRVLKRNTRWARNLVAVCQK